MPYITKEERDNKDKFLRLFWKWGIGSVGEFNYILAELEKVFIIEHGECYKTYNDLIGVLECNKLELYRRKIAKYEDTKIEANGDVF